MAWKLEAILVATGPDGRDLPIARTKSTEVVRILGGVLLGEARLEAQALRRLDPLLGQIGNAEAARLARIFTSFKSGDAPPPLGLTLVDEA